MLGNSDTDFTIHRMSKTAGTECIWNSVDNMQGGGNRKRCSEGPLSVQMCWSYCPAEPKSHLGPCSNMLMFSLDVEIADALCRAPTGDSTVNIQPMDNGHTEHQEGLQHNLFIICFILRKDHFCHPQQPFYLELFTICNWANQIQNTSIQGECRGP